MKFPQSFSFKWGCLSAGVMAILFVMVIVLYQNSKPTPAEQICNNLIQAGRLTGREQCKIANIAPDYLPAMFPIKQVDRAYVEDGMDGFEILRDSQLVLCSNGEQKRVIHYKIGGILNFEVVTFVFCGELLVNIGYSD